ncbi:hypothetical protein V2598_04000, partial [Tenacibaculum maritimum]|uniref:hypothetical protein n=1 Tax=Tenacibaculum maritimum TaxID=107401 RepID=UPI003876F08D
NTVQKNNSKSCTAFLREKKTLYRKTTPNLVQRFCERKKHCTEKQLQILYSVFAREKNTVQKNNSKSCTAFLREKKTLYRKTTPSLASHFSE